jgi:hypothetical protein
MSSMMKGTPLSKLNDWEEAGELSRCTRMQYWANFCRDPCWGRHWQRPCRTGNRGNRQYSSWMGTGCWWRRKGKRLRAPTTMLRERCSLVLTTINLSCYATINHTNTRLHCFNIIVKKKCSRLVNVDPVLVVLPSDVTAMMQWLWLITHLLMSYTSWAVSRLGVVSSGRYITFQT